MHFDVTSSLGHTQATLERSAHVNEDICLAQWNNHHDYIDYHLTQYHTFSCYMQGGYDVAQYKNRHRLTGGGPGKTFILPKGQHSSWELNDNVLFTHMYFSQHKLTTICEQVFDKNPVQDIGEVSFADNPWAHTLFTQCIMPTQWSESACSGALSHFTDTLLTHLVHQYLKLPSNALTAKGGLSARAQRHVIEYIDSSLDTQLHIETLASIAELSPYHFARSFRHSIGQTPHQFITERRLQKGYQLLKTSTQTISEISNQCGFSDQSHFGRLFKKRFAATPKQLRNTHA